MQIKPFFKIISAIALLIVIIVGGYLISRRFFTPAQTAHKFSTTYSISPDPAPADDPKDMVEVTGLIRAFDIDRNANRIAIVTSKAALIYDLATLKLIHSSPLTDLITSVRFSPDGSKLALGGISASRTQSGYLHIVALDTAAWKTLYEYQSETDAYNLALAWSPDGERLAFSVPDRKLLVVDVPTGQEIAALDDFLYMPNAVAWSPDGARLISTGDLGYGLRRWRLDTNQWVRLWSTDIQPAQQIAWSPDGKRIASGHFGGVVCIWNARNNQCEGLIRAHFNSVDGLAWSSDSQQIATTSGAIRIWDASNGKLVSDFGYSQGLVYSQTQWLNSQTIATLESSYTKPIPATIRFWDVKTGKVNLAFRGWDNVQGSNSGGVALVLDDIQIGADRTLLKVSLKFDSADLFMAGEWNVTMRDSQGKIYPLTNITPDDVDQGETRVYQTVPLPQGERITLDLLSFPSQNGIPMLMDTSANSETITFDPSVLQVGESTAVNVEINANGWMVHLNRVEKSAPDTLIFQFAAQDMINGVALFTPSANTSYTQPPQNGTTDAVLKFNPMPNTPIQLNVTRIFYQALGAWQLDFSVVKSMFTDLPAFTPAPALTPAPEALFTSQDPLFLEIQNLIRKYNQSVVKKGWVHAVSETAIENTQARQSFPPQYYREEQWFEVDGDGWVLRSLTTDFDKGNQIIQQNVSVGTHGYNLSTGEASENPLYRLSFDLILSDLEYALKNKQTIFREETTCQDGAPCLALKLSDGFSGRQYWINRDTGQIVKLAALQYSADGVESVMYTQTFRPAERTSAPPQEVLDALGNVVFP